MVKTLLKNFKELDESSKHLFKLNLSLFSTVGFIIIYVLILISNVETKTNEVIKTQESLSAKTVAILPNNHQLGGYIPNINESNLAVVSTNITFTPVKVTIDRNDYTFQTEYIRGDVVLIKFFNIYGLVEDKSLFSKDYYRIIYRDNNHTINSIDLPVDFLLKPSAKAITPFIFTP